MRPSVDDSNDATSWFDRGPNGTEFIAVHIVVSRSALEDGVPVGLSIAKS